MAGLSCVDSVLESVFDFEGLRLIGLCVLDLFVMGLTPRDAALVRELAGFRVKFVEEVEMAETRKSLKFNNPQPYTTRQP